MNWQQIVIQSVFLVLQIAALLFVAHRMIAAVRALPPAEAESEREREPEELELPEISEDSKPVKNKPRTASYRSHFVNAGQLAEHLEERALELARRGEQYLKRGAR